MRSIGSFYEHKWYGMAIKNRIISASTKNLKSSTGLASTNIEVVGVPTVNGSQPGKRNSKDRQPRIISLFI